MISYIKKCYNLKGVQMKEKIENEEIKEYLINMVTNRLQYCDVFTRTFRQKIRRKKIKS